MPTQFLTSCVTGTDSFEVGQAAAKEALSKMAMKKKVNLAILFCSIKYDYSSLARGIKSVIGENISIIGCTSAGQFSNENLVKDGISLALIASDSYLFFPGIGTNLKSDPIQAVEHASKTFPKETPGYPYHSAIVLLDGLAGKGEETVLAASSILGSDIQFAGGAAADHLAFKETAVFNNDEAFDDAVSMCLIASRQPIVISFKHGHKPISPPLRITRAEGHVLYELEGKPALDVWKEYLAKKLKDQNFDVNRLSVQEWSKIFLKYEAGLMAGSEYKIRFPISCNSDGSLNFVCSMIEGSVIKIMDSEKKDQIESAHEAAKLALKASEGLDLAGAIIFNCACQAMILQEEFSKAVDTNKQVFKNLPFIGCETYGEIAMEGRQLSGFHNTTSVVMLFPQ